MLGPPRGRPEHPDILAEVFISHSQADRAFAERLASRIQALGANLWSDESGTKPGETWDSTLRQALESSDEVVLVVPEPRTAKANSALFEAGAARAPVVAVIPESRPSRVGEVPSDVYGLAVFDGSRVAPEALAKKIVSALSWPSDFGLRRSPGMKHLLVWLSVVGAEVVCCLVL